MVPPIAVSSGTRQLGEAESNNCSQTRGTSGQLCDDGHTCSGARKAPPRPSKLPATALEREILAGDRLTALDASFLHLEDASAHMHVASVMLFEGDPPPYDELLANIERRLHLVPRYRQKLAFVPFGPGPPALGRRSPPEPALPRALDRPALSGQRGAAARPRRARVRPAARPRQAALGAVARRRRRGRPLRAAREDPSRARRRHLGRRHRQRAVRHLARPGRAARPGPALASPPRAVPRPSCSASRCSSGRAPRARSARSVRALLRGPRRVADAAVNAAAGVGAMAWAGPQARSRDAVQPRRSARTGASPGCAATSPTSRRSRTSSAARSTTSCCRPSRARSAATCAAAATAPTASS